MEKLNKILMVVIVILVVGLSLTVGMMFGYPSNSNDFEVGNSTFSVPKEYEKTPHYNETKTSEGITILLSSGEKGIDVTEFTNKESMDKEISEFRIPDKTIHGELLYKESSKTINGTDVIFFEDTGMPFTYYFFEKNGKFYSIYIYLPDNSNIHDELANMIIKSLKNQTNPFNPFN